MLNRRGFLGALTGLTGFGWPPVLDPERLLWRAGAKHISIPPMIRLAQRKWMLVSNDTGSEAVEIVDQFGKVLFALNPGSFGITRVVAPELYSVKYGPKGGVHVMWLEQ